MHALVRKSSFSKAQGFVKPAPGARVLLSTPHSTRSQPQYQTWGRSTSVNTTQHTVPVSIPDPGSEYFSQHHTAHNHSLNTRPGARVLLSTPHHTVTVSIPDMGPTSKIFLFIHVHCSSRINNMFLYVEDGTMRHHSRCPA